MYLSFLLTAIYQQSKINSSIYHSKQIHYIGIWHQAIGDSQHFHFSRRMQCVSEFIAYFTTDLRQLLLHCEFGAGQ